MKPEQLISFDLAQLALLSMGVTRMSLNFSDLPCPRGS